MHPHSYKTDNPLEDYPTGTMPERYRNNSSPVNSQTSVRQREENHLYDSNTEKPLTNYKAKKVNNITPTPLTEPSHYNPQTYNPHSRPRSRRSVTSNGENSSYQRNSHAVSPRRSNTVSGHSPTRTPTSAAATNAEAAAAVVAQEMNAIKTLKRLSIGALPALDPDLPNYGSDLYRHSSDTQSSLHPSAPTTNIHQGSKSQSFGSSESFDFSSTPASHTDLSNISSSDISSESEPLSFDSPEINASHASQLLWVPAHVHPEIAPQEWKTFVQNKVAEIKAEYSDPSSKSSDNSTARGKSSKIHRRNSRLSRQIKDQDSYTDGADILEKRKSRDALNDQLSDPTIKSLSNQLKSLGELESLAMDPLELARSLSMNTSLYSYYSNPSTSLGKQSDHQSSPPSPSEYSPITQLSNDSDSPILPTPASSLRRSTRTVYNKSSIRRGKRDIGEPSQLHPKKSSLDITSQPSGVAVSTPPTVAPSPTITSPETPRRIRIPIAGKTLEECPYVGDDPLTSNPNTKILLGNDYDDVPKILTGTYPEASLDISNSKNTDLRSGNEPTVLPQKAEKSEKSEKFEKVEKVEKVEKPEKSEKSEKPEKPEKPDVDSPRERHDILLNSSFETTQADSNLKPSVLPSDALTMDSNNNTFHSENILNARESPDTDVTDAARPTAFHDNSRSSNISQNMDDDETQAKSRSRKGTWGWLFSGAAATNSPQTSGSESLPSDHAITEKQTNKLYNQSSASGALQQTVNEPNRIIHSSQQSAKGPGSQISKDRISSFFSKKKSSASLQSHKSSDKNIEQTSENGHEGKSWEKGKSAGAKDKSRYLSVESASRKQSRSPSPNNRRSRSKSPIVKAGKSEKKLKNQSKQRSRYRSRTRSPDRRKGDDAKDEGSGISSGQSITAKPMPETSIVAYSPEAAAYYGAPYQIPPHQMSDKSLIMMHHRYPLHIERAIYRLSHIKLANAKRPLVQQVLLSNFMYAYLNLINQGFIQQQQQAQLQMQLQLQQQQQPVYQGSYGFDLQQDSLQTSENDNDDSYEHHDMRYDQSNNSSSVNRYEQPFQASSDIGQTTSVVVEEIYGGESYHNPEEEDTFYDTQEHVSF